jgi:hypothetical protein
LHCTVVPPSAPPNVGPPPEDDSPPEDAPPDGPPEDEPPVDEPPAPSSNPDPLPAPEQASAAADTNTIAMEGCFISRTLAAAPRALVDRRAHFASLHAGAKNCGAGARVSPTILE